MPSLLFRCFSLFLPHLRTLTQGKRSENCLRFKTGGSSLCLYPLLSRNILFFPALTVPACAKKKISGEAIFSRYQRALSGFWARFRILNLIARLCSYVIILNWQMEVSLNHDHNEIKTFERIITATIFQLKVSLVRLF